MALLGNQVPPDGLHPLITPTTPHTSASATADSWRVVCWKAKCAPSVLNPQGDPRDRRQAVYQDS